jgi:hypothetical protein
VYVPAVGDFDRNGYDDIFWYASGTAQDYVWYSEAGRTRRTVAQVVSGTTYRVAAGDVTRDGYDDVLWHAPGTAVDYLWRGQPSGFVAAPTIAINDTYQLRDVDHDANGSVDVFAYRDGQSRLLRGGPSGFTGAQPAPVIPGTSRPVTGDLTGDLRDDLLAYVPGTGADRLYPGTPTGLG